MTTSPEALMSHASEQAAEEDEPSRRCAISRAYYASYHRCLLLEGEPASRRNEKQPGGGVHQQLIERLFARSRVGSAKQRRQGKLLANLMLRQRKRRVTADYLLDEDLKPNDVENQIADAHKLFAACDW
ncbi:hypothetical protein ACQ859_12670 [Roseateles chitinivorans]|uniref:hypothetical protein n=1 Tax=Roseateles chitinivorans TaxID=2917965 RepID=UPI003D66EE9F